MPSVSVAQRKYFGWLEHSPDAAAERKKSGMSHQQMHDFAATKEKGLPQHVPHMADGGDEAPKYRVRAQAKEPQVALNRRYYGQK